MSTPLLVASLVGVVGSLQARANKLRAERVLDNPRSDTNLFLILQGARTTATATIHSAMIARACEVVVHGG